MTGHASNFVSRAWREGGYPGPKEMEYLYRTALDFVGFPPEGDIHQYIADRMQEILGGVFVAVTTFDASSKAFQVRAFGDLGGRGERLKAIVGVDLSAFRMPAWPDVMDDLSQGELIRVPGGFHDLTFGSIPRTACAEIEGLFSIEENFVLGIARGGTVYGSAAIGAPAGRVRSCWGILETFLHQASLAVQRKHAEEAAQRARGEIAEWERAEEERRKFEGKMLQIQKWESLGVLAGGLAHDFNNLLTGVLGNLEVAKLDLPSGSRVASFLEDAGKAARRLADLTERMQSFAGKGRVDKRPLSLSEAVREAGSLAEVTVGLEADLDFRLEDGLPPIRGDAAQVKQVVMNLVQNGVEALLEGGGKVTVSTGRIEADRDLLSAMHLSETLAEGLYVFLEVSDDGCGMDRETEARIFDPFFSTKFAGRGLGLAAVLGIVRSHGGAIGVRSHPGGGSTFRVFFPPCPEAVSADGEASPGVCRGGEGHSILLIDEEEVVRSVGRAVLERAGHAVLTARSEREGLALFEAHAGEIKAVVLGLPPSDMDGREVFEAIRDVRAGTPVILSGGHPLSEIRRRVPWDACVSYLRKPYDGEALCRTIAKYTRS